jgi:hypothetical protein
MAYDNKPYESWTWDDLSQDWVAPDGKEVPTDGKPYRWDEEAQNWVEIIFN